MIEKIIVLSFLTIAISHITFADYSSDTQSIGKENYNFDINVDGKKLAYRVGYIIVDYTPDQLKVNRNEKSKSADITLTKGFVMLINGNFVNQADKDAYYDEYAFVKNQYLNVKATGSANLAADGKHVENCKFEWAQTTPIYKNLLKDPVRDSLVKNLEETLGEQLCKSVNEVITKHSV